MLRGQLAAADLQLVRASAGMAYEGQSATAILANGFARSLNGETVTVVRTQTRRSADGKRADLSIKSVVVTTGR